jgi:hypothetical protein
VRLRPDASRLGVVTSLAVSGQGRLALCWSQARSPDRYDARVACRVSDKHGMWGRGREILPDNSDRQYLPAATFQGKQLWVAAYVSSASSTRLVAVRGEGDGFDDPITVNRWPVPSDRICAPHPPDCLEGRPSSATTSAWSPLGDASWPRTSNHPPTLPSSTAYSSRRLLNAWPRAVRKQESAERGEAEGVRAPWRRPLRPYVTAPNAPEGSREPAPVRDAERREFAPAVSSGHRHLAVRGERGWPARRDRATRRRRQPGVRPLRPGSRCGARPGARDRT